MQLEKLGKHAQDQIKAALGKKRPKSAMPAVDKTTVIPDYVWIHYGIPVPIIEYQFHESRKWKLDFSWPDVKVAVEIEGGTWSGGRHVRAKGYQNDIEKYNALTMNNWSLLRFVPNRVDYKMIKKLIKKNATKTLHSSQH